MCVGDVVQCNGQVGVVVSVWGDNVTVTVDGCRWVWAVVDCVVVQHDNVHDVCQF